MSQTSDTKSNVLTTILAYWAALVALGSDLASSALPSFEAEIRAVASGLVPTGKRAQSSTVIVAIVMGAALLIGFFLIAVLNDALPSISNADLASDKDTTLDRIGTGLLLGGVVIIILMAAVVLRILRGL